MAKGKKREEERAALLGREALTSSTSSSETGGGEGIVGLRHYCVCRRRGKGGRRKRGSVPTRNSPTLGYGIERRADAGCLQREGGAASFLCLTRGKGRMGGGSEEP